MKVRNTKSWKFVFDFFFLEVRKNGIGTFLPIKVAVIEKRHFFFYNRKGIIDKEATRTNGVNIYFSAIY